MPGQFCFDQRTICRAAGKLSYFFWIARELTSIRQEDRFIALERTHSLGYNNEDYRKMMKSLPVGRDDEKDRAARNAVFLL